VWLRQLVRIGSFTAWRSALYTALVIRMKLCQPFPGACRYTIAPLVLFALCWPPARGQDAAQKPGEKPAAKSSEKTAKPEKEANPAQIELLETKVRFESNGDSGKEVHARVKINSELGVRQFARLNFDFNRSFESVEIPLVHITHAGGGSAEILPGAVTDQPNPAVVNAPAYQDVRVKSVRILGLEPGDTLEYRVIKTASHHPLAPDFWFDHTFDRTGVVTQENFELDVPSLPSLRIQINPGTPPDDSRGDRNAERSIYRWTVKQAPKSKPEKENAPSIADISVSTFSSWNQLADRLASLLIPTEQDSHELYDKALSVTSKDANAHQKMSDIYDFVSKRVSTLDLPLGSTGYRPHKPSEILAAGSGTAEDKFFLFAVLANNFFGPARAGLIPSADHVQTDGLPSPSQFDHLLTMSGYPSISFWMDLNIEVAPFLMIPAQYRQKPVFVVGPAVENRWETVTGSFPFPATQKVLVGASLGTDGKLTAKVRYTMRGDNELVLRVAFHQAPKEKWKELAQLLSITDGFRGQVTTVTASDPYATKEPFTLEYEIEQPKFVDWSKRTVRIPPLLPQLGLPDPAGKPMAGAATAPITLGTPLEVETSMSLRLPPGTSTTAPTGTSVERDYATYSSHYSVKGSTITASRHIHFILREIPAARGVDYNAFLHAVQNDEAQDFTLERATTTSASPKP
jgi:hypothetical protein